MRHELRTPLNAIIGYGEMLQEDARDYYLNEYQESLDQIVELGRELNISVQDLLGTPEIRETPESVDVNSLRQGVVARLTPPAENLLAVSTRLVLKADAENQSVVSSNLERVHTSAKRLLELVRQIENHRGYEWGDGADGSQKALDMVQQYQSYVSTQKSLDTGIQHNRISGGRILVVDDNEMNRSLLFDQLYRQGHTVEVVDNGMEAIQRLKEKDFDIVLLDVMMPVMDGIQTLEILKNDPDTRELPVIMLSAVDDMDKVVHCIELGADEYLPKPFERVLLRARIGAALEKKRLRDRERMYLEQIELEKKHSEELLRVILPEEIVTELRETNSVAPRRYEGVAVMFCDIVGFTPYCEANQPEDVVSYLQGLVEAYEDLAAKYKLEKIKTVGDAFMAAAGLLIPLENPVANCVRCGLDMLEATQRVAPHWEVRIGVHVGPVIAGVVGRKKYLFDLWGDTVNTAARVQSYGKPGTVYVSPEAWSQIERFGEGNSAGVAEIRGKRPMELFRVDGIRFSNY
ncbi:MAG: response regulator [Chloroflexi bacterium]|nr:response regulator [Chloroflexota bacterium]